MKTKLSDLTNTKHTEQAHKHMGYDYNKTDTDNPKVCNQGATYVKHTDQIYLTCRTFKSNKLTYRQSKQLYNQ